MMNPGYTNYDRALLYRLAADTQDLLGMAQDSATSIAALSTQGGFELQALIDLQAAQAAIGQSITDLGTAVQAGIALIQQLQTGSVAAADVEDVVAKMTAAAAAGEASAAALNTAVTPVVTPPPATVP